MSTVAYDASFGLRAYKTWRENLKQYPAGTIFQFVTGHVGATKTESIAPGTFFLIEGAQMEDGLVYRTVKCSVKGTPFKKTVYWGFEQLARRIAKNEIVVI